MKVTLKDDPSIINSIFQELKENINLNIAQDITHREKTLQKLIEGYEAFKPQFDEALKQDLGYNPFLSNFAAHSITLGEIKDLLSNLRQWAKPRSIPTPMALGIAQCKLEYQPLGLALVVSSWNYPIYTSLPQVAAAIAAGNSVILKPSQYSPYCSKVLSKMFHQYMDPRFYRVIQGGVQVGKALTKLPFDIICFTGSTETGRLIAIQAAKNLTPCILELGGKCPVIIDQTADLQSAAKRIIFGKFLNCGQTCVGVDHVYVNDAVYEKFKKILLSEVKNAFDSPNLITSGDYGKINNLNHLNRLKRFYQEDHKGKTLYGGNIIEDQLYFQPTVIQKPDTDSSLMKQQIFGPILPIFSYKNFTQLVQDIRKRPKSLAIYVFTRNQKNFDFVKSNTSSGALVQNDAVVQLLNCHLPFGGVGQSGYGRYHGQSGFISFSNPKSLVMTQPFDAYPLSARFFPFTDSNKRMMTFLLKVGGTTYTQLKKTSVLIGIILAGVAGFYKFRPLL